MNYYDLSPKDKKQSPGRLGFKVATIIVAICVLFVTLAYSGFTNGRWVSFSPIEMSGVIGGNHTHWQVGNCTSESRDRSISTIYKINAAFEDNYILAKNTSRIALAPIVSEMQKALRELRELSPDACGQLVQTKLIDAYDEAIHLFLSFTGENVAGAGTEDIDKRLQSAYRYVIVYEYDPSAPFLLGDAIKWTNALYAYSPTPEGLNYLAQLNVNQCDGYELWLRVLDSEFLATRHYVNPGLFGDSTPIPTPPICAGHQWLDTPTPTTTPAPTPTPKSFHVVFRIEGEDGAKYSVQYLENESKSTSAQTIDDVDALWEHSFAAFAGTRVTFRVIDKARSHTPSCIILVDQKSVFRKTKAQGDYSVTCEAVVH